MRRLALLLAAAALVLAAPASAPAAPARALPFAGKTLMPREIADLGSHTWGGLGLVKFTATALGESHGSLGAWHDNFLTGGPILSRDCGLMQINIPARYVGTELERQLRTDSLDKDLYLAAAAFNVDRAHDLYDNPWRRDGHPAIRLWQPWVAYTSGWATFSRWWVWARPDLDHWAATGRYVQQAITGTANYRLVIKHDVTEAGAVTLARSYARAFNVTGTLGIRQGIVKWTEIPAKPTAPPADNVGPRPVTNSGV